MGLREMITTVRKMLLGEPTCRVVVWSCRIVLGSVFLWTGLAKTRLPYDFLSAVYDYELFGPKTGLLVASALPWVEIVVGATLLSGLMIRGGLLLSSLLLVGFTVVRGLVVWSLGLMISCGCAGPCPQVMTAGDVFSAGSLAVFSLLGLACHYAGDRTGHPVSAMTDSVRGVADGGSRAATTA